MLSEPTDAKDNAWELTLDAAEKSSSDPTLRVLNTFLLGRLVIKP